MGKDRHGYKRTPGIQHYGNAISSSILKKKKKTGTSKDQTIKYISPKLENQLLESSTEILDC